MRQTLSKTSENYPSLPLVSRDTPSNLSEVSGYRLYVGYPRKDTGLQNQISGISDWRTYRDMFVASQDVKDSSRRLYTRTLSQFFLWIETGLLDREREELLEKGLPLPRGEKRLNELTREDILEYKDLLQSSGIAPLTIASYIVSVRRFYEWTESLMIYPNIAKGIKVRGKKQRFKKQHLPECKCVELLEYYREKSLRDFAIVNLLLRTGLRTIEIVRADVGDITYKMTSDGQMRRVLKVWGKGRDDKEDYVVLTEKSYLPIRDYLESRRGVKPGDPLFCSNSRQNKGERLTTKAISGLCKEGLREIGLDGKEFTAHSLRHTTGVEILKKGGTLTDVMRVLRHSSIDTSRIYVESIEEELRLQNSPESLLDCAF